MLILIVRIASESTIILTGKEYDCLFPLSLSFAAQKYADPNLYISIEVFSFVIAGLRRRIVTGEFKNISEKQMIN